ncbi:hypothetical protein JL2886_01964 [Phaeobacter gallaeciensis]|uniref:Uncharacterized protein n=1 Tax=Phaeobacter gallaeciensis TaxID=60890 RepID=A0A1B0ZRV0_9RHOB|nr:hypothetical protein JL2886_01964 [Phaeobacter gallaeciensis]
MKKPPGIENFCLRLPALRTRTPFTGGAEALRGAAETLLTDRKDG